MTSIMIRTRDQSDGRIHVSDGQGTSGTYPADYHDRRQAHTYAARQYLAELKGWPDADVEVIDSDHESFYMAATRRAVTPSRRPKPVAEALRVARYLQLRPTNPGANEIAALKAAPGADLSPLLASDLQALLDYIREA